MESMAKESCFFCKRELGWGKAKHKNSELLEKGIEPDGMSHEDICCDHCFDARKKGEGTEKQLGGRIRDRLEPAAAALVISAENSCAVASTAKTALNQQPRPLSSVLKIPALSQALQRPP